MYSIHILNDNLNSFWRGICVHFPNPVSYTLISIAHLCSQFMLLNLQFIALNFKFWQMFVKENFYPSILFGNPAYQIKRFPHRSITFGLNVPYVFISIYFKIVIHLLIKHTCFNIMFFTCTIKNNMIRNTIHKPISLVLDDLST